MGRRSGESEGVSGSTRRVTATMERNVAGANSRAGHGVVRHTRKELMEMLDRTLKEEQGFRTDERLTRIVRIVFEQYDGNVKAFVESFRYRAEVNRKTQAASDRGGQAVRRNA